MKFYKAFVWLLFALFTFFSTSFATGVYPLTASRMYPYQIGEPIVITIPIEELYLNGNEAIGITTLSPEATESPYGYEIQSNYMPYSFEIRQSQRINGNYYDWHNQQLHWIELTAIANIVGSFEGCVSIYNKSNPTQKTRCLDFSFEIANTISSPSGVAIMFADSAASFEKQIEINSFLKSVDGQNHTLHNAYIQYYLTKSETSIPIFDVWWSPGHTCNKIYKCENNNYIIRQYLKDYWNITPNAPPKATAQVGYRENPNLYSQILGDKVTYYNEMYSSMRDYSYTDPAITANSRAYERNAHYNDKIVLFSESGEVLWGNEPAYESFVNCNEGVLGSDFLSETYGNDYWCSETESSSSSIIPRSSSSNTDFIIRSSSSSNASAFHDLSILFADGEPNNVYYGQFKFKIANKGTSDISIGGAEIRFYYNGDDFYDTDLLNVASGSGYSTIASVSKEQCGEDQYAIKIKLSDNAVSKARNLFPEYDAIRVNVNGQNMLKNVMYSWMNNPTLTENNKVVLLDASGSLLYGTEPWVCNGYNKKKLKLVVSGHSQMADEYSPKLKTVNKHVADASARIYLTIENKGDSVIAGPVFIDFQVTHPAGHIPLIEIEGKNLSVEGQSLEFYNRNNVRMQVMRISAGNKHTFRFTLPNGINGRYKQTIEFKLLDRCLFGCEEREELQSYRWDLSDDWSALDIKHDGADIVTDKVPVYNFENKLLYGKADPSAPIYASHQNNNSSTSGTKTSLKQNHAEIGLINPNRTDAAAYAGGQILSGGDFESPWLQGWSVSEPDSLHVVKSIRAQSPQGSRHISMDAGVSISQTLNQAAIQLLADSGAVLTIWHKEGPATVSLNGNVVATLRHSNSWVVDTIPFPPFTFTTLGDYVIKITPNNYQKIYLDDAVLIPSHIAQPTTYATRFTNSGGEEIETRAYDGDKEQLVTTSERDAMGRLWKKFLPIAMECNSVEDCNSNLKTLYNPSAAISKYIAKNPDYPDAGGYPYVETQWKPDPLATKDVEGVPGAAFSITGGHVVRAFSSGVNLSGIDMLDSASLNSAIKAVYNERTYSDDYGNKANFHAAKDTDPTHLWELNLDQNGNAAFTVKDGEGRVIISGALKKASGNSYVLATRSVNELDARGNVTKSHPPMSCEYTNAPANCVAPSTYDYDSQSRVIKSWEPDADTTVTYYDIAGRVRAKQTRQQIDSGAYSVVVYDHLDRTVYTGEWKTNRDRAAARAYFNDVQNQNNPVVDSLTPGTVTRTFYDRVPTDDTLNALNVKLIPAGEMLKYTRGRVAAVVSDVKAVLDDNGDPVPASNGKDSVIRVSTASSYDKYGRVVKAYAYDPTMPADSLKMLAVETEYDVGGKVLSTTKYPYGLKPNGMNRKITERYVYDRLGRVSDVYSKNGVGNKVPVAHYDYYPTGSVRTVKLGNSLTLSYTYHISGAVKTAEVRSADNRELYADTLYYEDCGNNACTPQYNGNISRMAHHLAHENNNYGEFRDVRYTYDELNRLTKVDDSKQDVFDEMFAYDAQGRITAQRRAGNVVNPTGGEYSYYSGKNRLKSVADNMGGTADERNMSDTANFVYDSVGNLTYDKSKGMEILYDWRGMPIEFIQQSQPTGSSGNSLFRLTMAYDGSGRRISKTRWVKSANSQDWEKELVTHYTGIGTEVRESFTGANAETKVVVNMPNGLGRYGIEDAENPDFDGMTGNGQVGYIPNAKFEWYLKNHLGSTMLVYGTQADANPAHSDIGTPLAAYDYRAFGEMVELLPSPTGKVTENFTGKEHDDEIALDYFGARYLDPMLGLWTSVDPMRQFTSPYLYAGNGVNPIGGLDPSGTYFMDYDGNVTEGEFVPPEFQGFVSPDELIELQYAIDLFMESPGNVETLMSMAKYTLNHNVETRYWYNSEGQNSFGCGKTTSVRPGLGSGSYIHVHNWRSWTDTKNNEGLSWQNRPNKDGDLQVSRQIGGIMGYEIRTGRIYYGNKHKMADQFLLMQLPAGKVYDAQEYSGEMEDAR